eukprot:scaffold207598_cov27-Tisochrysis_lutea.AAC.3
MVAGVTPSPTTELSTGAEAAPPWRFELVRERTSARACRPPWQRAPRQRHCCQRQHRSQPRRWPQVISDGSVAPWVLAARALARAERA